MPGSEHLVGYSFVIRGGVGRRDEPLVSRVDVTLPSAPPPGREAPHPSSSSAKTFNFIQKNNETRVLNWNEEMTFLFII